MYEVITVTPGSETLLEPLGTKEKFWFELPPDQRLLFKRSLPGSGEHWAEKTVAVLCVELGLPHASYELATYEDQQGVVTPMFVPNDARFVFGNELLARFHADYPGQQKYKVSQHTLSRVMAVIRSTEIDTPMDWECPAEVANPHGVFLGYLMLDCLVANQDRHDQNWGLIASTSTQRIYLCPTFDHGSSLGRNETDQAREDRLTTKDAGRAMPVYVRRARTAFYESTTSKKSMFTLDAYVAWAKTHPAARRYWEKRLRALSLDRVKEIFNNVPDTMIGDLARKFACEIIRLNRERILGLV